MFGLVIGGIASGVGKTTFTLGLISALRKRGLTVQPFKVGPDYIDPSQHTQAAGRPSRNLDSWMVPEPALRELFVRAASRADAAIVEGVMGLFDGRTGGGEVGSTAHVAKMLGLPVLLVVDAAKAARSAAATVLGCASLDPDLRIIGVVLNNVASERHAAVCSEAIESLAKVPVLGWLPRDPALRQEERYLGLVPSPERQLPVSLLDRLADQVNKDVDLDRLTRLATVPAISAPASGLYPAEPVMPCARIALAQDAAFNFYYQDSLDLLTAWGAELVPFSPLQDEHLPPDIQAMYLGGGFPELLAAQLAANTPMLASVRAAADAGLPIYAECGGLMYLQEQLIDADERPHQMVGWLPGESTLVGRRLTLGYREARARHASLLATTGQILRGHEFHWSVAGDPPAGLAAYDLLGPGNRLEGFATGNVLASYLHVHFASDPSLAPRFIDTAARSPRPERSVSPSTGQLRRHVSMPDEECGNASKVADRPTSGLGLTSGPLLQQYGLPPSKIEALSHQRLEARIGHLLPDREPERSLAARLVYAAGDPDLASRVVLAHDPISAAVSALTAGVRLVVDVSMVAAGISRPLLTDLGTDLTIAIQADGVAEMVRRHGITRSAAGILALGDGLDGSVVAIGNAPTALLALLDLVAAGAVRPAAVIGVPVGFVAAEESKELLLQTDLPSVVVRGTRGGSALAAAAINYLLRLAAAARPETTTSAAHP
ncbi:MAG: cobyrinate a,c-diamide synthase [Chloroflexota bacterium]